MRYTRVRVGHNHELRKCATDPTAEVIEIAIDSDCYREYLRKSRGLGDTVAKLAKCIGADKVAKVYEQVTGRPCGCADRQAKLNQLVPYAP